MGLLGLFPAQLRGQVVLGHGLGVGRAVQHGAVLLRRLETAAPFVDLLLLDGGTLLPIHRRAAAEE